MWRGSALRHNAGSHTRRARRARTRARRGRSGTTRSRRAAAPEGLSTSRLINGPSLALRSACQRRRDRPAPDRNGVELADRCKRDVPPAVQCDLERRAAVGVFRLVTEHLGGGHSLTVSGVCEADAVLAAPLIAAASLAARPCGRAAAKAAITSTGLTIPASESISSQPYRPSPSQVRRSHLLHASGWEESIGHHACERRHRG